MQALIGSKKNTAFGAVQPGLSLVHHRHSMKGPLTKLKYCTLYIYILLYNTLCIYDLKIKKGVRRAV